MLCVVRHAWACPIFPEITKHQYLQKGLSYFFVFVACSYTCIEAIVLSCSFSWVWSDMPKVLQSNQSLISLERLSDFVDFLHVAIYMLLDIHWIYKNMPFLVGIVRHWLSTNQVARCFKFTKLENYIRYQIDFCI